MLRSLRVTPAALALAACFHDAAPTLTGDASSAASTSSGAAATSSGAPDLTTSTTSTTSTATTTSTTSTATTTADPSTTGSTGSCPMGQVERPWYLDDDGDGYGVGDPLVVACEPPPGAVDNADDCDDMLAAVHPGADELCNGLRDDDCDGLRDEYSPANLTCDGCGLAEHGGATYWACLASGPFLAAEGKCQSHGAAVHLAHIRDALELAFVRDLALAQYGQQPATLHFWLGLHRAMAVWGECADHPEPAAWVALDGQPVTYLPWMGGEPNNFNCDPQCTPTDLGDATCLREQCVDMIDVVSGEINDERCYLAQTGYVCKAPL